MTNFDWLEKKTRRSVINLRLWAENPRLNPEEAHITLMDYAEDFTYEKADREDFIKLARSIAEDGFIALDPVVVWQNPENEKFYVAEGNRRVVVLKLLLNPDKSPKSIRTTIKKLSAQMDLTSIKKIPVNVAPSFEDAEWYINQRNSSSSLHRPWSRVQQQRWINELYAKYEGDLAKILSITKLDKSEIDGTIRILKIKEFVKRKAVKSKLTEDEFEKANSYRFPITILERFFTSALVKEKWGIEFDGIEVKITSNQSSFFNAYVALIKAILNPEGGIKIDTRTITANLEEILNSLPAVDSDGVQDSQQEETDTSPNPQPNNGSNPSPPDPGPVETNLDQQKKLKGDPNRPKIIVDIYNLNTDSYRLEGLFNELKNIPITKYPNHIAAALRVFLDLAVLKYIETESLEAGMKAHYRKNLAEIQLKNRLEYIKANKLSGRPEKIVNRLLTPDNEYSLDVLNGYVHGSDTHYITKSFLNGFWDSLFPVFKVMLDIKEQNA